MRIDKKAKQVVEKFSKPVKKLKKKNLPSQKKRSYQKKENGKKDIFEPTDETAGKKYWRS